MNDGSHETICLRCGAWGVAMDMIYLQISGSNSGPAMGLHVGCAQAHATAYAEAVRLRVQEVQRSQCGEIVDLQVLRGLNAATQVLGMVSAHFRK